MFDVGGHVCLCTGSSHTGQVTRVRIADTIRIICESGIVNPEIFLCASILTWILMGNKITNMVT